MIMGLRLQQVMQQINYCRKSPNSEHLIGNYSDKSRSGKGFGLRTMCKYCKKTRQQIKKDNAT